MSQTPPSNPYGQPGPPGDSWQPPRQGRSNVFKFWMGVLLCLPVLFVAGALQALPVATASALSLPQSVGQFMVLGLDVALFAGFIAGLVVEKTRFIVLGVLAGIAVLFVVAAGACVLLIAGFATSN